MRKTRVYTFRLYPDPSQEELFRRTLGCRRKVWNLALEEHRRTSGKDSDRFDTNAYVKRIPAYKLRFPYLTEVPSQALQQAVRDLGQAFKNHRMNPAHFGLPRFKKKKGAESFRLPQGWSIDPDSPRIRMPKAGYVRFRAGRVLEGKCASLTVERDAVGRWFARAVQHQEVEEPTLDLHDPVGLDLGVVALATLSDGTSWEGISALRDIELRIAKEQRRLARKVGARKGEAKSRRFMKQKRKVARLQAKAKDIRHDIIHKVTRDIANNHGYVAMENLTVKSMTGRAHSSQVRQKAGLNKAILDQGWGMFASALSYKLQEKGGVLDMVDAAYTSRTCSVCGHEEAANRPTRDHFCCRACGHTDNADVNAAKNILRRAGQARIARAVNGESMPSAAGTYGMVKATA